MSSSRTERASSFSPADGDLEKALAIAKSAGELLLGHFRKEKLAVEFKGPRDLVTIADHASESLLVDQLQATFPDHALVAEESHAAATLDPNVPTWFVDPLDGTTNFAHGHPFFAVSMGLWCHGRAQLGIVHAPALGETYFAERERGAHSEWAGASSRDRAAKQLAVSQTNTLSQALLATGFSYGRREMNAGGLDVFQRLLAGSRGMRRCGSAALDLAYVAAGNLDGYWEYYLQPHDVAAGALLVVEAGGSITDVAGGEDYLTGGSLVAANPALYPAIVAELESGPKHPGAMPVPSSDGETR